MLRSRCYEGVVLRSIPLSSHWCYWHHGSRTAAEQEWRTPVTLSPYISISMVQNSVALRSSRQHYSTEISSTSHECRSEPTSIPIPCRCCSSRCDGKSCSSDPSLHPTNPHHPRKTGIQRDVARQQFQKAFWTLCEDRRTCYRDDVVWSKLQPYRQALTDAILADIRSPLFPALTSCSSSHSPIHAFAPKSSSEDVPLIASLSICSDGVASTAPGTNLVSTTEIDEKWKGRLSYGNKHLQEIIQIARRLPVQSVKDKEEHISCHLENVCAEEDERELFVVDVLLSTMLNHPDELTVLLTSALFSSSSSSSEDTKEFPASNENVFPTFANTATTSTTSTLSHFKPSSTLSPRLYMAILQSLLWLGRDRSAIDRHLSSTTTKSTAPSVQLDRESIARLAGVYMGLSLQAFQSYRNDAKGVRDHHQKRKEKIPTTIGLSKETSVRSVRAMDGVWSAFFIAACVGQMKSKLLDLWWNHMCVFYDSRVPPFTWQGNATDEVEEKNTVGEFGGREECIEKENETVWNEGSEERNGGRTHSCTMEKKEKGEEEHLPSWIELMSTMLDEEGEEATPNGAYPPASSASASSFFFPPNEEMKGKEMAKRKGCHSLPYEAVAGVMAATADNSDIERILHIFHVVKQRGLRVHSPSTLYSSSWTVATDPSTKVQKEKDTNTIFSSTILFFPPETSSCSSSVTDSTLTVSGPTLLQQHVHIRLLSKLLASTKFANDKDGGLRALVISNVRRDISPSVLLQSPWEVINDLLIGLNVASAMHLVKTRAGVTQCVPSSSSSSFESLSSGRESTTRSTKGIKTQRLQCDEEEEKDHTLDFHRQKEMEDVPFFIWAALLRRCARDHMVDEAEALFSFLRACGASISSNERKELASIMVRMYATFSPPDSSDALHCFLEHILKSRDTVLSASESKNASTSHLEEDTVHTTATSSRVSHSEGASSAREKTNDVAAEHRKIAPPFQTSGASDTLGIEDRTITDDVLYSLLIRSADSKNASMMYFLESCADGVPLSMELFESLFGSYSYQTSLRTLQKRLPHDYSSSKLDSLIRIPSTIDAHLRREEAQLEHGQPVVDSTGESF